VTRDLSSRGRALDRRRHARRGRRGAGGAVRRGRGAARAVVDAAERGGAAL